MNQEVLQPSADPICTPLPGSLQDVDPSENSGRRQKCPNQRTQQIDEVGAAKSENREIFRC